MFVSTSLHEVSRVIKSSVNNSMVPREWLAKCQGFLPTVSLILKCQQLLLLLHFSARAGPLHICAWLVRLLHIGARQLLLSVQPSSSYSSVAG